jgi:hypothetical protein
MENDKKKQNEHKRINKDAKQEDFLFVLNKKEKSKELNERIRDMILGFMEKEDMFPPLISCVRYMLNKDVNLLSNCYEFSTKDIGKNSKTGSYRTFIKIGIFENENEQSSEKKDKNYNKQYGRSEIGYIYNKNKDSNTYDLYGNLIEIPVFITGKYEKKIPSTTFVCSDAKLSCPRCPSPGILAVTSQGIETNNGFLIATEGETSSTNIKFPKCGKHSCHFSPAGSWQNVSKCATINEQNQLLNNSTISCLEGGTVSISDPNCDEHGD